MKRVISTVSVFVGISAVAFFALVNAETTSALSLMEGVNAARGDGTPGVLFGGEGSIFTTVVNVLLFLVGALSVIMLIIGGLRYALSGGNSSSVTAAKNTILYAIVGLIIAFLAFAVVNWVLAAVTPGGIINGGGSGGTGFTDV